MDKLQTKVNKNLAEGLIVKSYREMCNLLGEESKGGDSKKAQLKDWQRYFDYEKQGNKFIITKLYNEPLEKTDGRDKGNNAIYVKYIETLLLHLLAQEEDKTLVCTKNYLLVALGMTDIGYNSEIIRKVTTKVNEIKSYEMNEFDNRAYQMFHKILFSSLNNLKNRCLITYKEQLYYSMIDETTGEQITGIATDSEVDIYAGLKREVLEGMGYDHLRDIYFHNKTKEFYEQLTDKAYDEFGWDTEYKMLRIGFTKKHIINAIPVTESQLTQLQIKQQKMELNSEVVDALNNNAVTRYENMLAKYQKEYNELCIANGCDFVPSNVVKAYLPPKNYIEVQHLIAEELVRIKDRYTMKKVI